MFQNNYPNWDNFVEKIENNSSELLKDLFDEFSKKWLYPKSFKYFVLKRISEIQEKLELRSKNNDDSDDEEEEIINVPLNFNDIINLAFSEFKKRNKVKRSGKDEKEIIENIYQIYNQIKTKDFNDTNFSQHFFKLEI